MFVNYKLEELNVYENEIKYLVSTNKQSFAGRIICCFLKFSTNISEFNLRTFVIAFN